MVCYCFMVSSVGGYRCSVLSFRRASEGRGAVCGSGRGHKPPRISPPVLIVPFSNVFSFPTKCCDYEILGYAECNFLQRYDVSLVLFPFKLYSFIILYVPNSIIFKKFYLIETNDVPCLQRRRVIVQV